MRLVRPVVPSFPLVLCPSFLLRLFVLGSRVLLSLVVEFFLRENFGFLFVAFTAEALVDCREDGSVLLLLSLAGLGLLLAEL